MVVYRRILDIRFRASRRVCYMGKGGRYAASRDGSGLLEPVEKLWGSHVIDIGAAQYLLLVRLGNSLPYAPQSLRWLLMGVQRRQILRHGGGQVEWLPEFQSLLLYIEAVGLEEKGDDFGGRVGSI